jgi:hypothetical protein
MGFMEDRDWLKIALQWMAEDKSAPRYGFSRASDQTPDYIEALGQRELEGSEGNCAAFRARFGPCEDAFL